jgi:hypothetical protein
MAKISAEDKIHKMKMIKNLTPIKDMSHILLLFNSIQIKILIIILLITDIINHILLMVLINDHYYQIHFLKFHKIISSFLIIVLIKSNFITTNSNLVFNQILEEQFLKWLVKENHIINLIFKIIKIK